MSRYPIGREDGLKHPSQCGFESHPGHKNCHTRPRSILPDASTSHSRRALELPRRRRAVQRYLRRIWDCPGSTVGNWFHYELTGRWQEPEPASPQCPRCAVRARHAGRSDRLRLSARPLSRRRASGDRGQGAGAADLLCTTTWPGLDRRMPGSAMLAVLAKSVHQVQRKRMRRGAELFESLALLLPQHGPGKKHHRVIALTEWQQPSSTSSWRVAPRFVSLRWLSCDEPDHPRGAGPTPIRGTCSPTSPGDIIGLCQQSLDRLGHRLADVPAATCCPSRAGTPSPRWTGTSGRSRRRVSVPAAECCRVFRKSGLTLQWVLSWHGQHSREASHVVVRLFALGRRAGGHVGPAAVRGPWPWLAIGWSVLRLEPSDRDGRGRRR